ncbi:SGNH hydrolase-type esterase domain-containing protein [Cladorrhinum sp. PSN259]|nr:SGNH hydrolase-type esterase domain-containing protein [Cladorrhinum sp. PSN259]
MAVSSLAATTKHPLRIMPLGASVTYGVGSSTGNSYRQNLLDLLLQDGHQVNFVGRRQNGNFSNNHVEATSGYVISQIATAAREAAPLFLPNIVLVDAGTNNCNNGGAVPDAGKNVTSMIRDILSLSPGCTVVLATLLENKIAEQDACRVDVNRQYRELVSEFEKENAKVLLVDMRSQEGPTTQDLYDTRHPNDVGYRKMAVVWKGGVDEALQRGLISAPVDV